jgi:ribonuclease P protein component
LIWRIRERDVFQRLSRDGRRARAGVLWCTFLHDPTISPPQVAFAIGRAVGPAVIRNRCRRRLRALLADKPPSPGWYLIGARPDIAGQSFDEIQRDLVALMAAVDRQIRHAAATPPMSTASTTNDEAE